MSKPRPRQGSGPARIAAAAAAILVFAFAGGPASAAGKCEGDSARFRIMPKAIGRPDAGSPAPYALPCDSMVVPPGQTTRIYGSAMVHFGNAPATAGKITVKGELIVEGKAGNPAYLSGSVSSTEFGYVPGPHSWEGLEIDSGATLRMNHVRMFNAPTALVLFTRNVVLQDCFFRGISGLVLPDTSLFLNPEGQTLDRLDLRGGKAPALAKVPGPERKEGTGPSRKRSALMAAGGIGIAALVLAGGWLAYDALSADEGTTAAPEEDDPPRLPDRIPDPVGGARGP